MAEAVVAAKMVEDRYIVLFPCHVIKEQKPKHKEPEAKTREHRLEAGVGFLQLCTW